MDATLEHSAGAPAAGGPAFRFDRLEDLLRGRAVRGLTVDGVDAVFVNDPVPVRRIMVKDSRQYGRGDLFRKGRNISTVGMLAEDETVHRHYRRLASPFLRSAKVPDYESVMRAAAEEAVSGWRAGEDIDVQAEMCRIAGTIALRALFPDLPADASAVLSDRLAVLTWARIRQPLYGRAAARTRRSGPSRDVVRAGADLERLLARHVTELLRAPEPPVTHLAALLADADEDGRRRLTVAELCDEAYMMLTSATVTTASVMSWSLHVLSGQPAIEELLLDDLALAAAGRATHPSYTLRFFMEVMRLYPPVWISSRKTTTPVTVGGRTLPPGVNVVFSSYLLHRDAEAYPDPHRFDPDRWLSARPGAADGALYIPFGVGPKGCVGEPFAWRELEILLGAVLRRWKLRAEPGRPVQMAPQTTLHPRRLRLTPEPR
jgi:cyclooctatin synthase